MQGWRTVEIENAVARAAPLLKLHSHSARLSLDDIVQILDNSSYGGGVIGANEITRHRIICLRAAIIVMNTNNQITADVAITANALLDMIDMPLFSDDSVTCAVDRLVMSARELLVALDGLRSVFVGPICVPMSYSDEQVYYPVSSLGIDQRIVNSLHEREVFLIGELVALTRSKLLGFPGIGKKSLNDIVESLGDLGLALTTTNLNPQPRTQE